MSGEDHGHSVTAWTAVTLSMVGFVVGGIGFVVARPVIVAIGVLLNVAALLYAAIMRDRSGSGDKTLPARSR